MIARLFEDLRDVSAVAFRERLFSNSPEGKDEGLSRAPHPFFGQIEGEVAFAVDLQSGIADEQGGVTCAEHGVEVRSHCGIFARSAEPLGKQNLGERDRKSTRLNSSH